MPYSTDSQKFIGLRGARKIFRVANSRQRRQVAALRDELLARAAKWDALLRERDEACLELAKLRALHARGRQEREAVARQRAEIAFLIAQREPDTLLH
jgi:hypothetical protein